MEWVDYVILLIIALSAVISVLRGFIREALSLAGLVFAVWAALTFADELAVSLEGAIDQPSLRLGMAFFALFLSALLLTAVVNYYVGKLVQKTGLSGTDRMLGIIFGVARGIAIVGLLVLLAGLTPLPGDAWWDNSIFLGHFEQLAIMARDYFPPDVAEYFVFQ